jgi:hypothetical protein
MKRILLATALIGGFSLLGQAAYATPYAFTSSGSFPASSLSGATAISSNQIEWGGTFSHSGHYLDDGSTMTANPLSATQSGNTPATADVIGSLSWHNTSTSSDSTAATVTADYKLTLIFTQPGPGGTNSETFDLTITNTANNARVCFLIFCSNTGDVNDNGTINPQSPSFLVDGLLISNFTFAENGDGSYSNGMWSNPEGGDSTLTIKANITNAPSNVPEPVSMALLGTGLIGLGCIRKRRRTA